MEHMKESVIPIALSAVALFVVVNLPTNTGANSDNTVTISDFSFTPQTLTVHTGTTVTWVNKDDMPHTVTSDDRMFKSSLLDTAQRFTFTFSVAGTYPYHCSVHSHMTGKIVVQ
jgi:plastocyanin